MKDKKQITRSKKQINAKHQNHYNYTNNCNYDDVEIVLIDLEFAWLKDDINKIITMWNHDKGLKEMSKAVNRQGDEVFLLLMHLVRTKRIKKRKSYIYGGKPNV